MDGAPFGREVVVDIYPLVTAVTSETEEPRDCVRTGAREGWRARKMLQDP